MQRATLPIILFALGFSLLRWALTMPLLEWEITSVEADYPPTYKIHLDPSPWITGLGVSLDDELYIFHKVWVSIDQTVCMNRDGLNIVAERSPSDRQVESLFIKTKNIISWLDVWSFVLIIFPGFYIWWIIVECEHRPVSNAVFLTAIVGLSFCLISIMRLLGPKISTDYYLTSDHCYGALTLRAELSKIHYEMLAVMLSGILAELGALSMMTYEIIRAIIHGSGFSKSAAG